MKFLKFFISFLFIVTNLFAQSGTYYNSISTSSPTFINDLKTRIRIPYTKVSYDLFDETNIANFASINNGNGTKSVFCVYSNYEHVYSGTFSFLPINREHTFAHSWQPTNPSTSGEEYSDQHHLFPTHETANSNRGSHPLGNVVNPSQTFLESKLGTNASGHTVFEPRDQHKGDVARALFYMVIRYDGISGNSWSFNWLNGTRLPSLSEAPQDLTTLINWHKQDPPDKWEIDRNNYVQSIQQNRNPFVDHPEWVNYINFNDLSTFSPVYAAEPANYVSNFSSSVSSNSITVSWTDALAGSQPPSGYLLIAHDMNNYFIPIDGESYSEDVILSDGAAIVNIPYSSADEFTFSNLSSNSNYYFTIYSYNGSGTQINYKIDGTTPQTNAFVSTGLAAEPTNHVTNFAAGTITQNSIQLTWTDASIENQLPEGYLILANNTGSFTTPSDGTVYADDTNLADGSAKINVLYSAADAYTFAGLNANTPYYFKIYPYNGSGSLRNYKTDGTVPSVSATTASSTFLLPNAWINEIHYDNAGTDINEFVEIVIPNSFTTSTELAKFLVTLYNGTGAAVYNTTSLSSFTAGDVNSTYGFSFFKFVYPVDGLQNGAPDGIALSYDGNLIQFLSYEGSFTGVGGIANGITSTDIGVSESSATTIGSSIGLTGFGNKYSDFAWTSFTSSASAGSLNSGQTFTGYSLNLTVLIEGLYDGGTMVQDTIEVELRNNSSSFNLVESKKIFLNSNGEGTGNFSSASDGTEYYIAIKHRNAIETWSKFPQSFSSGSLTYDFTSAASKAFADNMILKNGKYCIFSGDVNQDQTVDLTDLIQVDNDAFSFTSGYTSADLTGDELVDLNDLIICDNNAFNFVSAQTPISFLRKKMK